jgi:hypothetical protein
LGECKKKNALLAAEERVKSEGKDRETVNKLQARADRQAEGEVNGNGMLGSV